MWRILEAKCAEVGPPQGSLSVSEDVRLAGRRTPEEHEHEHEYRSVDELRRTLGGPVLRDYRLHVSTPWDRAGRHVSFSASGGRTASVGMEAPDAAWCREVANAVLEMLRPHTVWYGRLHRASYGTIAAVTAASLAAMAALLVEPGSPALTVGSRLRECAANLRRRTAGTSSTCAAIASGSVRKAAVRLHTEAVAAAGTPGVRGSLSRRPRAATRCGRGSG